MPTPDRYVLNHKELVTLIIRASNVHEGKWHLAAHFGMTAGNFGPTPDQMVPGAVVGLLHVAIQRLAENSNLPPAAYVDAAEVNPKA